MPLGIRASGADATALESQVEEATNMHKMIVEMSRQMELLDANYANYTNYTAYGI